MAKLNLSTQAETDPAHPGPTGYPTSSGGQEVPAEGGEAAQHPLTSSFPISPTSSPFSFGKEERRVSKTLEEPLHENGREGSRGFLGNILSPFKRIKLDKICPLASPSPPHQPPAQSCKIYYLHRNTCLRLWAVAGQQVEEARWMNWELYWWQRRRCFLALQPWSILCYKVGTHENWGDSHNCLDIANILIWRLQFDSSRKLQEDSKMLMRSLCSLSLSLFLSILIKTKQKNCKDSRDGRCHCTIHARSRRCYPRENRMKRKTGYSVHYFIIVMTSDINH